MSLSNARKRATTLGATGAAALLLAACGSSTSSSSSSGGGMSGMSHTTTTAAAGGSSHSGMSMSGTAMQGMTPLVDGADGTTATAGGLTLTAGRSTSPAGKTATLTLTVRDSAGKPVTKFERDQTKLMHLIVVRDDFTGYQHLHPQLGAGGVFTVSLRLPSAGTYHAIADFTTGNKRYALMKTITAPGAIKRVALPAPATTAQTDGYAVSLAGQQPRAGAEATLRFTVTKGGQPVTALQPYLGAYGHLVALRKPDLAYSHVHPTAEDRATGTITFAAEFPTAASYRLFLQFRAGGHVHTAPFTMAVG